MAKEDRTDQSPSDPSAGINQPSPSSSTASTAAAEDIQNRFFDAYRDFVREMQDACAPADVQRRVNDIYWDAMQGIQRTWSSDDTRKRLEDAYRKYIRSIQAAWTQTDFEAIDAGTMAMIGQMMLMTAWMAASLGIRTPRWVWSGWVCVPWC